MKKQFALMIVLVMFAGCATSMNETQMGGLGGAGLGAGLGAIIGNQTGHAGAGTAIGAAAGALSGALVGEGVRRSKESAKADMRQELAAQQYGTGYAAPQQTYQPPVQPKEIHTKYNARTGQTFPESMKFDPNTGEELQSIR